MNVDERVAVKLVQAPLMPVVPAEDDEVGRRRDPALALRRIDEPRPAIRVLHDDDVTLLQIALRQSGQRGPAGQLDQVRVDRRALDAPAGAAIEHVARGHMFGEAFVRGSLRSVPTIHADPVGRILRPALHSQSFPVVLERKGQGSRSWGARFALPTRVSRRSGFADD